MKKTQEYNYNLPEREDRVKINDLNQNTEKTDIILARIETTIAAKAPIHSPVFSGEPMAPKPGTTSVYERIITTGYLEDALEVEVL